MKKRIIMNAVKAIEANPKKYEQGRFGHEDRVSKPSCGSPCCIAGWICFLADGKVPKDLTPDWGSYSPVFDRAKEIADLTPSEASDLFDGWFGGDYQNDETCRPENLRKEVKAFFERVKAVSNA